MADMDDDELLEALGVAATELKTSRHTPEEERIIAGFEDILRFYEKHGRPPIHDPNRDIFERLYAVRLDQLRKLPHATALLANLDRCGLLSATTPFDAEALDEDALLAELGIDGERANASDITILRNVRSYVEIQAAESVATRTPCKDFAAFQALFEEASSGLKLGSWLTKPFAKNASIECGDFFIIGGQVAYVAEMDKGNITKDGRENPRLRVIFDNGTESDLLMRSLSRSLYPDGNSPVGKRLVRIDNGPLFVFGTEAEADDIASGTIYVLRSQSTHPFISAHRELIHKIGVTGGKVQTRIAGAAKDATYLLADVEIVATYQLHNINRTRLEAIFHRLFSAAQIELTINDRFGQEVKPKEWFLVPLHVIDEAVQRIQNGSISNVIYDPSSAQLID